jgi:hypothetical protein
MLYHQRQAMIQLALQLGKHYIEAHMYMLCSSRIHFRNKVFRCIDGLNETQQQ